MKLYRLFLIVLLLKTTFPLFSQTTQGTISDPASFIGIRLPELINLLGAPKAVHVARGMENWQDDVIFEYTEGNFFIFKDRVWKVEVNNAYGLKHGDPKAAALLIFGNTAEDRTDHMLSPLPLRTAQQGILTPGTELPSSGASHSWPMTLRVNFNAGGRVSAIYIYRSDF